MCGSQFKSQIHDLHKNIGSIEGILKQQIIHEVIITYQNVMKLDDDNSVSKKLVTIATHCDGAAYSSFSFCSSHIFYLTEDAGTHEHVIERIDSHTPCGHFEHH